MSKDSLYARNTERGYNVSVVWNKNGMHKSETKNKTRVLFQEETEDDWKSKKSLNF